MTIIQVHAVCKLCDIKVQLNKRQPFKCNTIQHNPSSHWLKRFMRIRMTDVLAVVYTLSAYGIETASLYKY